MIVDVTMLECLYIAETTKFFRAALRQDSPEVLQQLAAGIMQLEEEQVGQQLLIKLQEHLSKEEQGEHYYQ
jgi:hypothetical protein